MKYTRFVPKRPVDSKEFGYTYKNMYIVNLGVSGTIVINGNVSIDVEEQNILEDVNVHSLKWNLVEDGEIIIYLSDVYLQPSRIFQPVEVPILLGSDTETEASIAIGASATLTFQPPGTEKWEIRHINLSSAWAAAGTNSATVTIKEAGSPVFEATYSDTAPAIVANYGKGASETAPFDGMIRTPLYATTTNPLEIVISVPSTSAYGVADVSATVEFTKRFKR